MSYKQTYIQVQLITMCSGVSVFAQTVMKSPFDDSMHMSREPFCDLSCPRYYLRFSMCIGRRSQTFATESVGVRRALVELHTRASSSPSTPSRTYSTLARGTPSVWHVRRPSDMPARWKVPCAMLCWYLSLVEYLLFFVCGCISVKYCANYTL